MQALIPGNRVPPRREPIQSHPRQLSSSRPARLSVSIQAKNLIIDYLNVSSLPLVDAISGCIRLFCILFWNSCLPPRECTSGPPHYSPSISSSDIFADQAFRKYVGPRSCIMDALRRARSNSPATKAHCILLRPAYSRHHMKMTGPHADAPGLLSSANFQPN